jgi:membrane protein DedA with SNARE-associated domain
VIDSLLHPSSYFGFFLFIALTGCGLPLPEEVAVILAGVLSAEGKLDPALAFGSCLAGAIVGDAMVYAIGYRFGHSLLRRHPKFGKLLGADHERQFELAVRRHGFKVLLAARFMVGVRAPVYLAAGSIRMPFRKFLLWDLVCATMVVGAFFALSFIFGDAIAQLLKQAEVTATLVVLCCLAVVAFIALKRHRARLLEKVIENAETPVKQDIDDDIREAS